VADNPPATAEFRIRERGRGESAVLRGGVASLDSQRDCQQGDLATVEDDRFAGEFPGAGFSHRLEFFAFFPPDMWYLLGARRPSKG